MQPKNAGFFGEGPLGIIGDLIPLPNGIQLRRIEVVATHEQWLGILRVAGVGLITENVALSFSKVELDYVRQKPDGTPGETGYFKWDFSANKPF